MPFISWNNLRKSGYPDSQLSCRPRREFTLLNSRVPWPFGQELPLNRKQFRGENQFAKCSDRLKFPLQNVIFKNVNKNYHSAMITFNFVKPKSGMKWKCGSVRISPVTCLWAPTNPVVAFPLVLEWDDQTKTETDVYKSWWPAKWLLVFSADAHTNTVDKLSINPRQSSFNRQQTMPRAPLSRRALKVWVLRFGPQNFPSKLPPASFAKHSGTHFLTDCKCFWGKVFHGSHQDSIVLILRRFSLKRQCG